MPISSCKMKGNTSLDLKISISFLPSADEHLPCPSIYLPPPLPTLKFLGREKDTPKMSSTQLSGGTFSSFFKSFFGPQRFPHTPKTSPRHPCPSPLPSRIRLAPGARPHPFRLRNLGKILPLLRRLPFASRRLRTREPQQFTQFHHRSRSPNSLQRHALPHLKKL